MFESKINRGRAGGYAPLDSGSKLPLSYLPDGISGTGISGTSGRDGSQGSSGANGTNGLNGTNGTNGTSGTSPFAGVDTGSFATTGSNLFYGNQSISGSLNINPIIPSVSIGDLVLGGVVAYILQPGDTGYTPNVQKGLVATINDISSTAIWGQYGLTISGADGTTIGTGNQNTIDIVNGMPDNTNIAARLCSDLVEGGYSDWYLPSIDELSAIYPNRVAIGGLPLDWYWSSSEYSSQNVWVLQSAFGGSTIQVFKEYSNAGYSIGVRAVRSFSIPKETALNVDGNSFFTGNINLSGSLNISSSMIISSTVVNNGSINALNSDLIIDGGDIVLSGSLKVSGSVKFSTTNDNGDSLDLIIGNTNAFGFASYGIIASGSTENGLTLISNDITVIGVQGTVSTPGDTSIFATERIGYPYNDGPGAHLQLYKSGSIPKEWFYNSNATSDFPGDINIGYTNIVGITSGSLNVRNGNINLTGSLNVTGSVNIDNVIKLTPIVTFPSGQAGMLVASASYGKTNLYMYDGSDWKWLVTGSIA